MGLFIYMKKKITFQLNQGFHSKLNDMVLMSKEYVKRYFNSEYGARTISTLPYDLNELVLVNTYFDFEDNYIIEHKMDNYDSEVTCTFDLMEKIKEWYFGGREKKLLIRLTFDIPAGRCVSLSNFLK